jgi:hypothetical protein
MKHPEYFLIGMLGGLALELLQLRIYKGRTMHDKYKQFARSPLFWLCTLGLLAGAGLLAWGLNADKNDQRIIDVFVTGVAARSIIRDLIAAKEVTTPTALGAQKVGLKDIFL